LKHIKALASSIFSFAVEEEILTVNPWREVKTPKDAIKSPATLHYTIDEVVTIITSLVDHVDCQLVLALAYILGLRPGESPLYAGKTSMKRPFTQAFGCP
jgi:hypothetical protein